MIYKKLKQIFMLDQSKRDKAAKMKRFNIKKKMSLLGNFRSQNREEKCLENLSLEKSI